MTPAKKIADWLESRWVTPAYSGWLLSGLTLFYFMAATNTLSGWLYVLSGIGTALLALAAILPERMLRGIQAHRSSIYPVSAGEPLTIEILLENATNQPKTLLQVQDLLPHVLSQPATTAIETIAPKSTYRWTYSLPTQQRGIYRWHMIQLRTAAPLGLFWCRRDRPVQAMAIVYPTILPLSRCPLVDEIGQDRSLWIQSDRRAQLATEGMTRALRPYRWGDPTRLIHWRTSARHGELRVRELEIFTGGQQFVICLDSAQAWRSPANSALTASENFEQAVIAAASLYFYACDRNLNVKLWTAGTGLIQGRQTVLAALAATQAGEEVQSNELPTVPLLWLTQNPLSVSNLPAGSRWILWSTSDASVPQRSETQSLLATGNTPGLLVDLTKSLQLQLQSLPNYR